VGVDHQLVDFPRQTTGGLVSIPMLKQEMLMQKAVGGLASGKALIVQQQLLAGINEVYDKRLRLVQDRRFPRRPTVAFSGEPKFAK
jgi:hypothetical protein